MQLLCIITLDPTIRINKTNKIIIKINKALMIIKLIKDKVNPILMTIFLNNIKTKFTAEK